MNEKHNKKIFSSLFYTQDKISTYNNENQNQNQLGFIDLKNATVNHYLDCNSNTNKKQIETEIQQFHLNLQQHNHNNNKNKNIDNNNNTNIRNSQNDLKFLIINNMNGKELLLEAETIEDKTKWLDAIKIHIEYINK